SNDVGGSINVYISQSLSSDGNALCGYTRFPPSADRVFLAVPCADNEFGTFAHELGHYFTLFHTHGKTNNGTTDELVERVDCEILGDDICDTPADPNLTGLVSSDCFYTGNLRDGNGALFQPNPRNIMSYAPNSCRNFFSPGQYERIRNGFENGRSYLNSIFTNFTARFTSDANTVCASGEIMFTDLSTAVVAREWTFEGANTTTSILLSPTVQYDEPGIYDVTLFVSNSSGATSTVTREDLITITDPFVNVTFSDVSEKFDDLILPSDWVVNNFDQLETFEISNVSIDEFGGSLYFDNFNYNAETVPQIDEIELNNFDLRELNALKIEFSYAYTFRSVDGSFEDVYDSLALGYYVDCETDFRTIFQSGGVEFATSNRANGNFVPNQDEWGTLSFAITKEDLPIADNKRIIRPTLRNISRNGNGLYIDNVELTPDYSLDSLQFFRIMSISDREIGLRWQNPANNELGVVIERSVDNINYSTIDSVGIDVTEYADTLFPTSFEQLYYRARNYNSQAFSSYSVIAEVNQEITSISELSKNNENLRTYPNPLSLSIFINTGIKIDNGYNSLITSSYMYSRDGKLISKLKFDGTYFRPINVHELKKGIYFLLLEFQSAESKLIRLALVN
ncbi:MAG: PKD domain-containing protein, partial [Bacteroidota bacterium]